jgi:hypothetical protein
MNNLPFSKPGRFWRGNLHTHTTLSDGTLTPEEACNLYKAAGYDFVAVTDHFLERYDYPLVDTRSYRTQDFTTLIGAELHTGRTELGHLWHILAVGLPFHFAPNRPGETGPEIAARALEAGAYVAVAHPAWYGLTERDVTSLGPVHAIEVYNGTAADHNDKPDSLYMLDLMLMRGRHYTACATDDLHFKLDRHDAIRGWVYVMCEALEPDALLYAMKAGDYYSSTGPQIYDIRLAAGPTLAVSCSPADRIMVTGYGHLSERAYGNGITAAEFDLSVLRDSPFIRVTVRDANSGRAWSNPIWL